MKYRRHNPLLLIVLPFLVSSFIHSTSFSAETVDSSDNEILTQTFTIASYNINYGNPNLPGIVDTIRKADADVVALQETNWQSQRYLLRQLRRKYPYSSFYHAPAAGGFGFLSRFPLKNVKHLPLKYGWFGAYIAEVTVLNETIRIANLHLQPSIPDMGESLVRFFMRWKQTEIIRVREIQQVLNETPKSERNILILTGDFNSLPNTLVTRTLQNMGYIDSYASVTPQQERQTTWQWQVGDHLFQFRLDYLFHSPAWKTRESSILRCNASDHHLILNTLQRRTIDEK